jgi:pimeloyl-ACP methyl ester carboxylesterase
MTTFVTIPGIMSDHRTWQEVSEVIAARFAATHNADTRQDSSLEAMAARALAATSGDLVIAAHSMGGRVAMEMGRQAPERVKGMILASTGHRAAASGEAAHRHSRIEDANADMQAYARAWVPKVLAKQNLTDAALVARVQAMVEDCSAEVHARQNIALLNRPDAAAYLPDLWFPVLLVTGSEDPLSTEAAHAEIAALFPDAEAHVIAGSGHLLPFERPAALTDLIKDWLKRRALA